MELSFAERLKLARENLELTQLDVMNLTKNRIRNKTLSGYESGRNQPDFDTLNCLCDLYNVSADWILGRTNPRNEIDAPQMIDFKDNNNTLLKFYFGSRELTEHEIRKLYAMADILFE